MWSVWSEGSEKLFIRRRLVILLLLLCKRNSDKKISLLAHSLLSRDNFARRRQVSVSETTLERAWILGLLSSYCLIDMVNQKLSLYKLLSKLSYKFTLSNLLQRFKLKFNCCQHKDLVHMKHAKINDPHFTLHFFSLPQRNTTQTLWKFLSRRKR